MTWYSRLSQPARCPLRRPATMKQIRRCDIEQPKARNVLAQLAVGSKHLWRDRAGEYERRFRVTRGPLQPVASLERVGFPRAVLAFRLLYRAGRQPQIDRTSFICLQVLEGPMHHERKFVRKRRLEISEPRLPNSDQWRINRLVRATLRAQCHARW